MSVHTLNPLSDSRWNDLVAAHPAASVFHTRGWLAALHRTYGIEPLALTTCSPETPLTNGLVLCDVRSWLTGRRLVSVPFADHCDPLISSSADVDALLAWLREATVQQWRYGELRPRTSAGWDMQGFQPSATFTHHTVDLRADLQAVRGRMHESGIRRKIRRAEREGLRYEEGRSDALIEAFYRLFVVTRKRHGAPPPPKQWFVNLMACMGDAAKIRVAWKDDRAVGSIVTLRHRTTMVYKYGGSDAASHNLGAMPFLFWRAIEDAKAARMETFDLGRSDLPNAGLITFKERLGGMGSPLTYFRCSARPGRTTDPTLGRTSRVFASLPEPLLVMAGRFLYRHIA